MKKLSIKRDAVSGRFILGREAMNSISRVEGIHMTKPMKKTFRELDANGASSAERRKILASKYGNR